MKKGLLWVLGCCLVVALSACTGGSTESTDPDDLRIGPPAPCTQERSVRCTRLASGQWVAVFGEPTASGVTLVDMGGPGSALAGIEQAQSSLPPALRDNAVVALLEPWTQVEAAPVASACEGSAARWSWGTLPVGSAGPCADALPDLRTPDPADVLDLIKDALKVPVTAVVAYSFGATRTSPAWARLAESDGVLVVVAPAAPPGTQADALVSARVDAAVRRLGAAHDQACSGGVRCVPLSSLLSSWSQTKASPAATELQLFLLAAVNDADTYQAVLSRLFRGQHLSEQDQATVRRLALSYSRSTDPETALDSNAGFRAQMCEAYGPPSAGGRGPLAAVLASQLGPCGHIPTWKARELRMPARTCLVVNPNDPITSAPQVEAYRAPLRAAQVLTYTSQAHEWPQDLISRLRVEPGRCVLS